MSINFLGCIFGGTLMSFLGVFLRKPHKLGSIRETKNLYSELGYLHDWNYRRTC